MSPTERSLKLLRKEGWRVAVVEKWNHHAQIRQDLFGFADLLAFSKTDIMLVQVTSYSNMSSRRAKVAANEIAAEWTSYGGRIELHGWKKVGKAYMLKREVL